MGNLPEVGVVIVVVILAVVLFVAWRLLGKSVPRSPDKQEIVLMLLLSSPRILASEHMVAAVREAFGKDLSNVGDDAKEFAVVEGAIGMIVVDGFAFSVISDGNPIVSDPDKAAEGITELRMRTAFAEHRAAIILGCVNRPVDGTREQAYDRIGKLTAALVDDTALLVYAPEVQSGNLINQETLRGLRDGDPLEMMRTMTFDAIGLVAEDDPRLAAAYAEARRRFPEFVAAFHAATDHEMFLIKTPLTDGNHTEYMWVRPNHIDEARLKGTLISDPFQVRGYRQGSDIDIPHDAVADWAFVGTDGSPVGLFTEQIVRDAMH